MHESLEKKIQQMMPLLNEKQLRRYLGSEAEALGHGGIETISKISGKSRNTIVTGIKENKNKTEKQEDTTRIRKTGGGRKTLKEKQPQIPQQIKQIIDNSTFGNPQNPLTYTTKSTRKIKQLLNNQGYTIGHNTVANILEELGYSLQLNQKMLQKGDEHPQRNTQFEFINEKVKQFLESGLPVISIDAKKKENLGNFKNQGKVYRKRKEPLRVLDHDFLIKELGKVVPYGVYDLSRNEGFVNLGVSRDTAEFAVESISRWWLTVGKNTYPNAAKLYVNCDAGGSNGYRCRLFKLGLQEFADQSGLEVHVSHFPPGTSKWNKVEHRLFCYISSHWRGQPLVSVEAVILLIGSTTTTAGLRVVCVKDDGVYKVGIKVSDEDFASINLQSEKTCPDWNYVISPHK